MIAEGMAGLGALKTAFDMAKGLKDIDNAVSRNAAVIELQEKILTAQQAQSALIERVDKLEKEVAGFEAWDAEKNRYQLKDFGGGTFAYELKPAEARGEPMHRICPACYEQRHRSILQFGFRDQMGDEAYDCVVCKTRFRFGRQR
jgi:DNA-directed RNA polymerase subunit M/transcription elongation factor TFIIS